MEDGAGKPMEGARDEVRNLFFCQAQLAMHGAGPSLACRGGLQACKPALSGQQPSVRGQSFTVN